MAAFELARSAGAQKPAWLCMDHCDIRARLGPATPAKTLLTRLNFPVRFSKNTSLSLAALTSRANQQPTTWRSIGKHAAGGTRNSALVEGSRPFCQTDPSVASRFQAGPSARFFLG